MKTCVRAIVVAAAAAVATASPPAGADVGANVTTTSLRWHTQSARTGTIPEAKAILVTTASGARVIVNTRQLTPGNAYTLWWVLINNPAACQTTPCTPGRDILVEPQRSKTQSQILFGDGAVAWPNGRAVFSDHLPVGAIENGWYAGQGFTNPLGAEIHVVLNDHGPALPEFMPGMIETYRGGCSDASPFPPLFPATALADGEVGPNTCLLYQVAEFLQ